MIKNSNILNIEDEFSSISEIQNCFWIEYLSLSDLYGT